MTFIFLPKLFLTEMLFRGFDLAILFSKITIAIITDLIMESPLFDELKAQTNLLIRRYFMFNFKPNISQKKFLT